MKKNKMYMYFSFFIFCFFLSGYCVLAKTWECPYIYENGEKYTYKIDNEKGTMEITNKKEDKSEWLLTQNYHYSYSIQTASEEIKSYKDDYCPILFLSIQETITTSGPGANPDSNVLLTIYNYYYTYTTYTESRIRDSGTEGCVEKRDKFCLENFTIGLGYSNVISFLQGVLDKDDPNSVDKTTGSTCGSWSIIEKDIRTEYEKYKNCTTQNCQSYISNANSLIKKLKTTCKTILSYVDAYIIYKDEQIEDACVFSCLHLEENINIIKNEYGIKTNSNNQVCGFSERLIHWIANIIRWVKYIIPVVVIVLGILDFIKAMSADKEDEMKKAQQRFIRRLIAAALIFIAPFIIEFILNKLGFAANGCGIINL